MSSYHPYETPTSYGQQPYGQQSAYGQQIPNPGAMPQGQMTAYPYSPYGAPVLTEHPQGMTILMLGIIGWFVFLTAPVAWIMGNKAKKECEAGMYLMSDNLKIGRVLGMVVSILYMVSFGLGLLAIIIGLAAYGL